MSTAEKYVTGAYLVVFAVMLVYVLIMATKLSRLEHEVGELTRIVRERLQREPTATVEPEREQASVG